MVCKDGKDEYREIRKKKFDSSVPEHSPFTGMGAFVFGEVIGTMKDFAAIFAAISFWRFVFSGMSQPVVFPSKSATTVITRVRFD